jgi:hypothetical protein
MKKQVFILGNRKIQAQYKAFLIKGFLPLPTQIFRSKIAALMKNRPPATTNEKFVQYDC